MKIGVYAGSFDPFTKGHLDIIYRSLLFCDKLIIAVGVNSSKKTFFSEEERLDQIRDIPAFKYELKDHDRVEVHSFSGLLADFAKSVKANMLIRGIRSVSDFEYELNLSNINSTLAPEIPTIFLPTRPELAVVSSSMVKELAKHGADISQFVPESVAKAVYNKYLPNKEN